MGDGGGGLQGRERQLSFAAGETEKTVAAHGDAEEEDEPPRLRLISTNPDFAPCSCLARDVRILGKVLWVVRRV